MADSKKKLGKKWGSLKRAARGSVAKMNSPKVPFGKDSKSDFELFDDETPEDEFGERQKSPEELAKISRVVSLIEHFRLQCPQTHAGLVVAFTSTTLSPLNDPGIKFKWYRMGGGENNDQFLQIDESPRAWYPPTADDIGKKICANCEDNFDQGYCRYAEAGPVEADPLLVSMVESALKNGRHEVKDVSLSLGVKSMNPCSLDSESSCNFDMSASDRPSSLVSTDAMTYPFLRFPNNVALEVNYQGIFINTTAPGNDPSAASTRRGMNILPSTDLEMFCTLPASFVIVVSLPQRLRKMLQKKNNRRNNKNSFSDSEDEDVDESEEDERPNSNEEESGGGKNETNVDLLGIEQIEDATEKEESSDSGYEWIGYSNIDDAANGPGSELCMLLDSFLTTLPGGTTHFRICFSFADRMSRDAFSLACRVLAGFNTGATYRDRLRCLPWFSEDGEKRNVDVQSIGGNDLGRRLKELEDENSILKRQHSELNLQLMEQSESYDHQKSNNASSDKNTEEDNGTNSQAMMQLKTKVRDLEAKISEYRQKEMDWEKSTLEMEGRMKRIQSEGDDYSNTISELHQKIAEAQAEAGAMRVLSEKHLAEKETLKAQLDAEVNDNRSKLESNVEDLKKEINNSSEELKNTLSVLENERKEYAEQTLIVEGYKKEISQLQEKLRSSENFMSETKSEQERCNELLQKYQSDLNVLTSDKESAEKTIVDKDSRIETLLSCISEKDESIAKLESERDTLLNDSVSPDAYLAVEERAIQLEGERNQLKKVTESLQKDMKKVVKELQHQVWLAEEELARSNERCEELKAVMSQMAAEDVKRIEEAQKKKANSGLMGKMKGMRRQSSAHN